jgi:hypothetical protein
MTAKLFRYYGLAFDFLPTKLEARAYHEAPEISVALDVFQPGDRVIQAGAGVGLLAMVIASIVGPDNLWGLEPWGRLAVLCRENIFWEDESGEAYPLNVSSQALVSDDVKEVAVPIWKGVRTWAHSAIEFHPDEHDLSVSTWTSCIRLSKAVQEFQANGLALDVEGAEWNILMRSDLEPLEALMIEFHKKFLSDHEIAEVEDRLREFGFSQVTDYDDSWARIEGWRK